jgi:hypothetical protein
MFVGIYSNWKEIWRKFRRFDSGVIEDSVGYDVSMISDFRRSSLKSQETGIHVKSVTLI